MTKFSSDVFEERAERQRECERALNCEFETLTSWAESAGWSWEEIALALMELVEQYVLATACTSTIAQDPSAVRPSKSKTLH
ncbi:hypothetical protein [Ensifer sp. LCM 4579]|uniref:hypothetical protein n=1 Tax=Ensifer sp. LCM 4579 TaxID=1848292 RepID=UPI0008DA5A29|nr:hypothetical protein [Ensifer sp. LCM 4579]OHV81864.1 hypothetical protein LCM4579_18910 [Ensifer sp. LCM 4579]